MTKFITLLGCTGSIGTQVLDIVRLHPARFQIRALAAGKNLELLARQVGEFNPEAVAIADFNDAESFKALLVIHAPQFRGDILFGPEGLEALAALTNVDTVIVGLVGLIGLAPSLVALKAGKALLTANKETFVSGGHLVRPYLRQVVPIDSEHVAIHQCLGVEPPESVSKLYLTASGGPFRLHSLRALQTVTLQDALKHPKWVMGQKITIDSATMMNKGLEIIEAHWLFDISYDRIQVVVHPESIIHSAVCFVDGSILAQLGATDMHGPIQYAMTYPERVHNPVEAAHMDLLQLSSLTLSPPDFERFPCIRLAYEAGRSGSGATAVLNGADEVAVARFLAGTLAFMEIPQLLESALDAYQQAEFCAAPDIETVQHLDAWARQFARAYPQKSPISVS